MCMKYAAFVLPLVVRNVSASKADHTTRSGRKKT